MDQPTARNRQRRSSIKPSTYQTCQARAVTQIDGQKAILDSVFAQIGALSVESIRLNGHTMDGRPMREVIRRER
jgi:hypothetical protein